MWQGDTFEADLCDSRAGDHLRRKLPRHALGAVKRMHDDSARTGLDLCAWRLVPAGHDAARGRGSLTCRATATRDWVYDSAAGARLDLCAWRLVSARHDAARRRATQDLRATATTHRVHDNPARSWLDLRARRLVPAGDDASWRRSARASIASTTATGHRVYDNAAGSRVDLQQRRLAASQRPPRATLPAPPSGDPSPAPPSGGSGGRLRVATWNIHFGSGDTWGQAHAIANSGADVVLLQEAQTWDENMPSTYPERLRQLTGQTWYSVWSGTGRSELSERMSGHSHRQPIPHHRQSQCGVQR